MKKWTVVALLALAQFVMVLDSTVMNVSISTVVKDLDTTIASMQMAITFYTLTMASFMLLGGKLGDVWGRKRAFLIGSVVYACGSLITGLSANIGMLMFGWSLIEGLGAVLVIPAIAALIATNYKGKDRVVAFAIIGGVSGAAAAAGPLIGGYVTTYLSWRYVFFAEVAIMALVVILSGKIKDAPLVKKAKIDVPSVFLSAGGFFLVIFGMLQSKTWGWVTPRAIPTINGNEIAPLGISVVAYLILAGIIVLRAFYHRQQKLEANGGSPLLKVSMLSIPRLRSGLSVLASQYMITAAVFFVIPVYLQMTLGYDALKTGLKILPLSAAVIIFSVLGTKLSAKWSPRKIVRTGQVLLITGSIFLLGAVSIDLKNWLFAVGMFLLGAGLGLLASQLGNVNMSSVGENQTAEVGGLQGVSQNLGASLGTALIGSVLVATLTTAFVGNIQSGNLPDNIKSYVQTNSQAGVAIVPVSEVTTYTTSLGMPASQVQEITNDYADSQITALKQSLFAVVFLSVMTLLFSRNIPSKLNSKSND